MHLTPLWPRTLVALQGGSRMFPHLRAQAIAAYAGVNDDSNRRMAGHWGWGKCIYQVPAPDFLAGGGSGLLFSGGASAHLAATGGAGPAYAVDGHGPGAQLRLLSHHAHLDDDVDVLHLPLRLLARAADGAVLSGPRQSLGRIGRVLYRDFDPGRSLFILHSFLGIFPDH